MSIWKSIKKLSLTMMVVVVVYFVGETIRILVSDIRYPHEVFGAVMINSKIEEIGSNLIMPVPVLLILFVASTLLVYSVGMINRNNRS